MKKNIAFLLAFIMILGLTAPAFADNLIIDGDGLLPVDTTALNFGNVAAGSSITRDVLLAISRNGNGNVFKDNTSATISFVSTNDSKLNVSIVDNSISIPGNWNGQTNNVTTDQVTGNTNGTASSTITLTVAAGTAAGGPYTAKIEYEARGTAVNGTPLTRPGTLIINYSITAPAKVDATIVVGYNGVYDGQAHGAAGTATGVDGENLSNLLHIDTATFTDYPGGTVNWTFEGNAKYKAASGTANIVITKASASVTPNAASKIYGSADPILSGTLSGFLAVDNVTATYSRADGETVLGGPYTISATLAPIDALSNYDITYNTAAFTINPKPASVTPNAASKTYGSADPVLTGTLSGFLAEDGITATYSRIAGESIGTYTISASLSPLDKLSNYDITYNTANFRIIYGWLGIQQPINYPTADYKDPNMSRFKAGSTIPVKFKLGGKVANAQATFKNALVSKSDTGDINEDSVNVTATGGTAFRYDAASDQYIFNLSTKGLAAGTYKLTIALDDGESYFVYFGLK